MLTFPKLRRLFIWLLFLFNRQAVYAGDSSQADSSIKMFMRVVITLILLTFGIYILINMESDDQTREWAAGWVGAVLSYWFS